MTKTTIEFAGKSYRAVTSRDPKNENEFIQTGIAGPDLAELSGAQLLELHNLVSSNLGRGRVKRFSDTRAAVRRTWAILEEYDAGEPAAADLKPNETLINESGSKLVNTGKDAFKVELSKEDKAAIKQEAADRKAAAASSPPVERWRTPKRRDPSKRCYMPRPGSKQDKAYQLLTQEGGIRVEDFCKKMASLDKDGKNSTEWREPGTIWGGLNYLFVTQKGYGLEFDGERIRLLKGKEEVPFQAKTKS